MVLDGSNDPLAEQDSYNVLNLRLFMNFDDLDMDVVLWGRNVLDEEYRSTGFDPIGSNGLVLAVPGEPATYGITLRKNF